MLLIVKLAQKDRKKYIPEYRHILGLFLVVFWGGLGMAVETEFDHLAEKVFVNVVSYK
jgi:hypothetical protein